MPYASEPITYATATVAAPGTSVAATSYPPYNCYRIVVVNRGNADAYFGYGVAAGAALDLTTAALIPAAGLREFDLGTQAERGDSPISYDVVAGAGVPYELNIEYHNALNGLTNGTGLGGGL